jgi:serine/threonine protein kinase
LNKFIAGEIPEFSFIPIVTFKNEQNKIENDRFIVYEDAGLPLDSMMKDGWTPGTIEIKQFAKCFMEALDFLRKSNVVHRNIHLKSVVWIQSVPTIKLIALGHARYIGPLPFDRRVHKFLEDFMPPSSVALAPHASEDEAFPDIQDHVDSDDGCPTVGELEGPQSK